MPEARTWSKALKRTEIKHIGGSRRRAEKYLYFFVLTILHRFQSKKIQTKRYKEENSREKQSWKSVKKALICNSYHIICRSPSPNAIKKYYLEKCSHLVLACWTNMCHSVLKKKKKKGRTRLNQPGDWMVFALTLCCKRLWEYSVV